MIQNPSVQGALRDAANNDVWDVVGAGAPSNGTSGTGAGLAGPGSTYTDVTNKIRYLNTNTKASPTWSAFGVSGGTITSPTITTPTITGGTITGTTESATIQSDLKVLAATATFTSTTVAATLTGYSWTVVPGTYQLEVQIPATMTTNGGLTISDLLTTAVLTSMQLNTYAATATDNATAVSTSVTATASATKIFDSKTAAYTLVTIKGTIVVGTGGTFALQATQNTSNSDTTSVLLGGYARLTRAS